MKTRLLANYCSGISADSGDLLGLSSVKKVATLSDTPASLSVSPSDLAKLVSDNNATYYLTASQKSDYTPPTGYLPVTNAYGIALKSIENGKSKSTTMIGTVPISITSSGYNSAISDYLDVNGTLSSAITPTQNDDGTYTFTQDVALGASGSTVALVYHSI